MSISKQYIIWFWNPSIHFLLWLSSFSKCMCFRFTHCLYLASVPLHGCTSFDLMSILIRQFPCCLVVKYLENHPWIHSPDVCPVQDSFVWIYCNLSIPLLLNIWMFLSFFFLVLLTSDRLNIFITCLLFIRAQEHAYPLGHIPRNGLLGHWASTSPNLLRDVHFPNICINLHSHQPPPCFTSLTTFGTIWPEIFCQSSECDIFHCGFICFPMITITLSVFSYELL